MYENYQTDQTTTSDTIKDALRVASIRSYDAMTLGELLDDCGLTIDEARESLEVLELCDEIIITAESGVTYIRIAE